MTPQELLNCQIIQKRFEGREAIYMEKGVLRVRVNQIRFEERSHSISAEVEEIPTVGLLPSLFHPGSSAHEHRPLRWHIGAGGCASFSENSLHMGYGGWSLYFEPELVHGLIGLTCLWPEELRGVDRYGQVCKYLYSRWGEQCKRVFCDLEAAEERNKLLEEEERKL